MTMPIDTPDEHNDDQPVGRLMSRREILTLLGGAGVAVLGGCTFSDLLTGAAGTEALPSATISPSSAIACVVKPELTEGPYFLDQMLNRVDLRSDPTLGIVKEGTPLRLIVKIFDVSGGQCAPIQNAQVDVWHCDALGVYSGVTDRRFDTTDQQWLRGYQLTDALGAAQFVTIYPGWYPGRAVHIHFKVRTESGYEFTSQFFFDEATSAQVYTQPPYASKGTADVPNARDGIFRASGSLLTLMPTRENDGSYTATMEIGMDLGSV